MRNRIFIGLVIFVGIFSLQLPSSADEKTPEEYEALYSAGKFADALTSLEQVKQRLSPFSYSYNKGVIHHALGQEGLAVAYLEKARSLKPEDTSLDEPLETAKLALAKAIGNHRLDPGSYSFERWGDVLPIDFLFVLGGGFLGLCLLAFIILGRKMNQNWGLAFLCGGIWVLVFGSWSFWMDEHPLYILIADATVKSGPQAGVLEKGTLYTGTKVRRTPFQERDGHIRVRYSGDGDEGFLETKSLLLLSSDSNKEEK